jgi:cobyrinic acid a,c-diamide synthase
MALKKYPRIMIAGLSGDSGKTLVSCGLLAEMKSRGLNLGVFKKGPDYIDPAWLSLAGGTITRNLDTYLMGAEKVRKLFLRNAKDKDLSFIEGNRGLYDGFDSAGTHSTAELAKLLKAPVILVINVTKVTRTVAALVLGCKMLDTEVNIASVILNQVAGKRHEQLIKNAVESETGIKVVGSIPKIKDMEILPSRHLGLVTPGEYDKSSVAVEEVRKIVKENVEIDSVINIAENAENLEEEFFEIKHDDSGRGLKLGYFKDKIFSFYYPENLESLANRGVELVSISSIADKKLPDIDGLYIGGGFPESNIMELLRNRELMEQVRLKAESGLPIYAECGGLMYLAESIEYEGEIHSLSGVFPMEVKMKKEPQGHGYMQVSLNEKNPFFAQGIELRGHEFHYSRISNINENIKTCLDVKRGKGAIDGKDGLIYKNVFASYMHLHSEGSPEWADGFVKCMKLFKK